MSPTLKCIRATSIVLVALMLPAHTWTQPSPTPAYEHDRWATLPRDHVFNFEAFTTSFDGADTNDNDDDPDQWGIPEWVGFEIRKSTQDFPAKRPKWTTDAALHERRIAPNDATYAVGGTKTIPEISPKHRFVRGHMCPKDTAERISSKAAVETHTILNAVPQLQSQNNGVWKKLEADCLTWADEYESLWVVCGPVFFERSPAMWLGQDGEVKAAIPDALFKIVIVETEDSVDTLAYLIPNILPGEQGDPNQFLTSIDNVEKLTGLDFLSTLDDEEEALVESAKSETGW